MDVSQQASTHQTNCLIKSITLTLGVALFFLTDIAYGQKAVLVSEDTKCPVLKNKGTGRYSIEKSDIKQLFVPAFKTETQLKSETTIPVSSAWQKEKEITQAQSRKGGKLTITLHRYVWHLDNYCLGIRSIVIPS